MNQTHVIREVFAFPCMKKEHLNVGIAPKALLEQGKFAGKGMILKINSDLLLKIGH